MNCCLATPRGTSVRSEGDNGSRLDGQVTSSLEPDEGLSKSIFKAQLADTTG